MVNFVNKTALNVCKLALADIGTRSQITSVFPADGSTESYFCGLYYDSVLLHILRAANWSFAGRTDQLTLWKALPGTPENPTAATTSGWSRAYPAPPWTYSYQQLPDCVRVRKLIGQPQQVPISPPIFSGSTGTNPPISQRLPMARFELAQDLYDPSGVIMVGLNTTVAPVTITPGSGYVVGDLIEAAGGTLSAPTILGQASIVRVLAIDANGGVTNAEAAILGHYSTPPPTFVQGGTGGRGSGYSAQVNWVPSGQPVILTDQQSPLIEYTYWSEPEPSIDELCYDAFVAAMAGRLAQSLTGDKALARDKYALANEMIINARVADGNEGLTIDDHIPDWLRVRGAGGGLGYEMFFYPLGPLFPVAPLV